MLEDTQGSAGEAVPWGLTRMRSFPPGELFPYAAIVLDPASQTGQWLDGDGVPVRIGGKHQKPSTARETKPKTSLDGNSDEGTDQETD